MHWDAGSQCFFTAASQFPSDSKKTYNFYEKDVASRRPLFRWDAAARPTDQAKMRMRAPGIGPKNEKPRDGRAGITIF